MTPRFCSICISGDIAGRPGPVRDVADSVLASATVSRPVSVLKRPRTLLAATVIAGLALSGTATATEAQVRQALAAWTAKNPNTTAAIWRLDASGHDEIASYKAQVPRRPASTMKVVTAAAALQAFGPEYTFETHLYMGQTATYSGPVLRTPLYLKGYGDPTLSTALYSRRYLGRTGRQVTPLVTALKRNGITAIKGPVVVDETYFDTKRKVSSWPARYYGECQPLSALTVNQSYLTNARSGYAKRPALVAGAQLKSAMKSMKVTHTGTVRTGRTPQKARLVGVVKSPPLKTVTRLMLPPSDNFIAEMLTKNIGAATVNSGTTAAGTRATMNLLGRYLSPSDRIVDGSGLDRGNRLSAESLVTLLASANADPTWGKALVTSLPRGNEGTLRGRFSPLGGRLRAKTGYINGTSGLTGIVVSTNGQRYAFALLMNDSSIGGARETQNRLVRMLASGTADVPGNVPPPVTPDPPSATK